MDSMSSVSASSSPIIDKKTLFDRIDKSDNLPVLPDLALKVIYLSEEPDIYPAKVQALISQDPVLAARILQISNSPAYAGQNEILDIGHAVTRLGVKLSLDISLGFLLVDALRSNSKEGQIFDHDRFWRKSVLSAVIANELCGALKIAAKGQMFLSALIQDVGMLVLLTVLGEEYVALTSGQTMHIDWVMREREFLGADHAEVGAYLMSQWGMPEEICSAISNSHALFGTDTSEVDDMQYGVALSGVVAELWMANSEDHLLQDILGVYIDKMGVDAYQITIAAVLEEIPEASNVFDMTLLTAEEMAHIQ